MNRPLQTVAPAVKPRVRLTAFLLALLLACGAWTVRAKADGIDYSGLSSLNRWQYVFLRTVMSLALKDGYDNGVLPSVTAGQAVYEGGICSFPISIVAQNHFCIKAYSNWDGKVYLQKTNELYNSYADAAMLNDAATIRADLWRAYDSWEESVADHSNLFHVESKYEPVLAAENYRDAAYAIQESGYAGNSDDYAEALIGRIEQYGLDQLDAVETDENGVFGLVMDRSRVQLDAGGTATLRADAYPATSAQLNVQWSSDRPEVATVDANGKVTANRQGVALVTAVYNGKEACCVVEVDANAYVLDRSATRQVYRSPDLSSASLGKLDPGQPVKVISKEVYTGPDGTPFYAVSASPASADGQPVSGYVRVDGLYTGGEVRLAVGTDRTVVYASVGDALTVPLHVYADELKDKPVAWSSSDPDVAEVDDDGNVRCMAEGVSVISARIDGKLALTVTVYVGSKALKTLVAVSAVNLRSAPSTSGSEVLGVVAGGQEVSLVNDLGNGWYRILAIIGGHMLEGYASARYFREPSERPVPPTPQDPGVTYQTGRVNVEDSLNVRDAASTSGKLVAKLKNGDRVVILETVETQDRANPRWYRIRFAYRGETLIGYASAAYIVVTGTVTEPAPDLPVSPVYTVDGDYLSDVLPDTTVSAFRAQCSRTVKVFRNGSELGADELVASGDVRVYDGGTQSASYRVVVKSDLDGDGKTSTQDYLLLKRAILGTYRPTETARRAALISGASEISSTDYLLLKRAMLGTYQIG